ncbi:MAG: mobilization protein MobD [Oceanobacter sp.]
MSMIHFVGGEKGGVGKSVFSRLFSQYCLDYGLHYVGLDADQSHATTTRYYPEFTRPLVLEEFESTDVIMELALESSQQVIVDLPAQSQRFLDRWIDENGVLDMAEEMNIPIVFWYVVDDSPDSATLLESFLAKYQYYIQCVVVKNAGRGCDFSDVDAVIESAGDDDLADIGVINLPALHANTMFKINKHSLSFWSAINAQDQGEQGMTLMERQRTRVWLQKSHVEVASILGRLDSRTE